MSKKEQKAAQTPKADPKPAQAGEQDQAQAQAQTETQEATEPAAQPVIFRIEQARNLPELDKDVKSKPAGLDKTTFQAFKATDGRTMRVVELDGTLYAQEK